MKNLGATGRLIEWLGVKGSGDMRALRYVLLRLKKWHRHWKSNKKRASEKDRPLPSDFAYLIELGYLHKKRLLRDPDVSKVDVALVGRHLIITAHKKS